MKKIVCLLLLSVALCEMALAQSQYISYKPLEKENREAPLLDMGGILVYSKRGDLVITLTNVKNPIIKRNGMNEERPQGRHDGTTAAPRKPSKNFRGAGYPCGLSLHVRTCGHGPSTGICGLRSLP